MSATHFIVRKSTLDKRWDAFYSEPEIVALEQRVQQKATHTLRDFARFMSGGATPLKSEGDQHYTDAANGVPFIRVQNLTPTGELDLQDVKHITHSTNGSSLARSRLSGGELLVKITGVGRMAVASVVPDGLEANINQHIAAITTESKAQSEALAAYLNLDFVERLASRRTTGGTRPALDYNALLSIPVIDDPRVVSIMQVAYAEKRKLEAQAAALLSSIDNYLLAELSIILPSKPENTVDSRIFTVKQSALFGQKLDPYSCQPRFRKLFTHIHASKYRASTFQELETLIFSGVTPLAKSDAYVSPPDGVRFIRSGEITTDGEVTPTSEVHLSDTIHNGMMKRSQLVSGDLLIAIVGATIGAVGVFNRDEPANINQAIAAVRLRSDEISPEFACLYLRSRIGQALLDYFKRPVARANINLEEIGAIPLIIPPKDVQENIVAKYHIYREEARLLRQQAEAELKSAKQAVENLILGEA